MPWYDDPYQHDVASYYDEQYDEELADLYGPDTLALDIEAEIEHRAKYLPAALRPVKLICSCKD